MIGVLEEMVRLVRRGEIFGVATVLSATGSPGRIGHKMVVRPDGSIVGTIGGGSLEQRVRADTLAAISKKEGKVHTYVLSQSADEGLDSLCGGKLEVAIEVVPNRPYLLLVGAGHVARDVGRMCHLLEYPYTVVDDRPEMLLTKDWPGAGHLICRDPGSWVGEVDLTAFTHVLLMNYSYRHDFASLQAALRKFTGVLGMMGSERKRQKLYADLPEELQQETGRVRCPIGIDLPAISPAEIAVAVLAQIIGDRDPTYRASEDEDHERVGSPEEAGPDQASTR